jgi:hypothetical protein
MQSCVGANLGLGKLGSCRGGRFEGAVSKLSKLLIK